MKRFTDVLLVVLLSLGALVACEDNELEIDGKTPSIRAKFINADSLNYLDSVTTILSAQITDIDDSVFILDSLVQAGDSTDYTQNFETLEDLKSELSAERSDFNQIKTLINSGDVKLDLITGFGAEAELLFEDSATAYRLPLNINSDISEFLIKIENMSHGVSFIYDRDTVVAEGKIFIEATNIKVRDINVFDSVRFPCDTLNCNSNEASITLYF
ncbi:hypothetical protein E1176_17920 [Fulvivirga sp. RKSG066]|uniref:hypothetical protein n=1 Tax=Fulvivirga aurantia TaxID=2529383 RepID=UPI0012BC8B3B|nr:hypothetical protein [Fulvivirga aurantia]MTI22915.1 hypothetical protein [Fulvivirga aurantia]